MTNLLIVESPAKAKTISKYLGRDYEVIASFGHIRSLVSKSGSVDVNNDFAMKYEISSGSLKHVNTIVAKVKQCKKLILSPDPDREGEAIAWHILEVLQQKKALGKIEKIQRVTFNSVTKLSVQEAVAKPREIDLSLVNAQQSRVALDYLVGFTISPILWRKLPGTKSAGRVQSVALRIICDREDEVKKFKSDEYWTIAAKFNDSIEANLTHIDGGKLQKLDIKNEKQAKEISANLTSKKFKIVKIDQRNVNRKPYPPLNTSSLQQEASRKLGFSTKKTMMVAQSLYEGINLGKETEGLITYMRTDSVYIEPAAISKIRDYIKKNFGDKYLPKVPNTYKIKAKNAQEAHEAIRPTDCFRSPKAMETFLNNDQFKLYNLIWRRTVSSQITNMVLQQIAIIIDSIPAYGSLRASYSRVVFDGFDIISLKKEEKSVIIPEVKINELLNLNEIKPNQHFTEPPPRYNEASLVKKMEELGVGRPSTYASIISVLQDRSYVKLENKRFVPEQRGSILTTFLKNFFAKYVKYEYTAEVENNLDLISDGKKDWKKFLNEFWFDFKDIANKVGDQSIDEILVVINKEMSLFVFDHDEDGKIKDHCPDCKDGKLSIKLGKFGPFIGCSNYPECKHITQMQKDDTGNDYPIVEDKIIGLYEGSKRNISLKKGPYGFYLELEVDAERQEAENKKAEIATAKSKTKTKKKPKKLKPKRVSVPKSMIPDEIDIIMANKLMQLPRIVGNHPETLSEIKANFGPFGPYLLYEKVFYSAKNDDILTIDLDRAAVVIAEGKKKKEAKLAGKYGKKKRAVVGKKLKK